MDAMVGGIYIRSNINYQARDDLHFATLDNFVVVIKNRELSWYRPPGSPIGQLLNLKK